jgi:hypothetical protein
MAMTLADHGSALRADEIGPAGRLATFAGFPSRFCCPFPSTGDRLPVPGRIFLTWRSLVAHTVLQKRGEYRRLAVADVPGRGKQRDGAGGREGVQSAESGVRYTLG